MIPASLRGQINSAPNLKTAQERDCLAMLRFIDVGIVNVGVFGDLCLADVLARGVRVGVRHVRRVVSGGLGLRRNHDRLPEWY